MSRTIRRLTTICGLLAVVGTLARLLERQKREDADTRPVHAPPTPEPSRSDRPPVYIRMFGTFELSVRGRALRTGMRFGRELLAYLLLHPDGDTMARIVATIWPDLPTPNATERFRNALKSLRRCLRDASGIEDLEVVVWDGQRYRPDLRHLDADLWRFESALAAVQDARSRDAEIAALRAAIGLYTGKLLDGYEQEWTGPPRLSQQQRAVDAYARLGELHGVGPVASPFRLGLAAIDQTRITGIACPQPVTQVGTGP